MKSMYQIDHEYRVSRQESWKRHRRTRNQFVRLGDFFMALPFVIAIVVCLDVLRMLTS